MNKHIEKIHEIAFWGPHNVFFLDKQTSKIYVQELNHLEDNELDKLSKDFFFIFPTLWLYHGLLSNKHIENIHKIAFLGPHYIFYLEKPTSKLYVQQLYHLEDNEFVKVVKRFVFNFTRLCGFTMGF